MCGLFLAISANHSSNYSQAQKAIDAISHRGPDRSEVQNFGHFAIGHCRLSIIGLGPEGHQPMVSEDKRFAMAFNGEIFNFEELACELNIPKDIHLGSDSRLLFFALIKYGSKIFRKLRGFFAVVFCDVENRSFLVSRDSFGIKPLCYKINDDSLYISSEERGLIDRETTVEVNTCHQFLISNSSRFQQRSFLSGVDYFEPGVAYTIKSDGRGSSRITSKSYWFREMISNELSTKELGNVEDNIHYLTKQAVKRSSKSDVELCLTFSGGVDSSFLSYCLEEMRINARHFSIKPSQKTDEQAVLETIRQRRGLDIRQLTILPTDILENVTNTTLALESPFNDPSMVSHNLMMKSISKDGFKVALSGLGGDEIFLGYGFQRSMLLSRLAFSMFEGHFIDGLRNLGVIIKSMGLTKRSGQTVRHWQLNGFRKFPKTFTRTTQIELENSYPNFSLANNYLETSMYETLPSFLRYEDRNSMFHGIEARPVLLDLDLYLYLLRVFVHKPKLFYDSKQNKPLLRQQLYRLADANIFEGKSKSGLPGPLFHILANNSNHLRVHFYESLNKSGFMPKNASNLFERGLRPHSSLFEKKQTWKLFSLAVFENEYLAKYRGEN